MESRGDGNRDTRMRILIPPCPSKIIRCLQMPENNRTKTKTARPRTIQLQLQLQSLNIRTVSWREIQILEAIPNMK